MHLGDIKAGSSSPCTDEYFATIRSLFDTFKDPFVYTPGDNEWTDCHVASKNNGLYTPTERLQAVRALFFPVPGQTLGGRKKQVLTQADDPANSAYVENAMFMESRVVFAALNITGSNNDLASWGSPLPADAANYPDAGAGVREPRAGQRGVDGQGVRPGERRGCRCGVVLFMQADMWDPADDAHRVRRARHADRHAGGGVRQAGAPARGRLAPVQGRQPVLGELPRCGAHALHPTTPVAENVTRIVVEGSDGRTEYVRLTVDPKPKTGRCSRGSACRCSNVILSRQAKDPPSSRKRTLHRAT